MRGKPQHTIRPKGISAQEHWKYMRQHFAHGRKTHHWEFPASGSVKYGTRLRSAGFREMMIFFFLKPIRKRVRLHG